MELPERIAAIIKVNQHSAATFADAIGVQRSSISHILNGRNKPSIDLLEKILTHFPRVDASWLITGKAPAKLQNGADSTDAATSFAEKAGNQSGSTQPQQSESKSDRSEKQAEDKKKVTHIIVFYADRTFDTYEPS